MSLSRSIISTLLAASLVGWGTAAAEAQSAASMVPLAPVSAIAQSPRLRSLGTATTASWLESQPDGRLAIRVVSLKDGRLPREPLLPRGHLLAEGIVAASCEYDLALNPASTVPAIIWTSEEQGGVSLHFAEKPGKAEMIYDSPGIIESPTIQFDATGAVYAAWTEISGGISRVFASRRTDSQWTWTVLSEGERPYDVLPQLFAGNEGSELYWYAIDESAVMARMAQLGPGDLSAQSGFSLGAIPANRLPILYRCSPENLLGAVWLEQRETGEAYIDMDPRALEGPVPLGDAGATVQALAISEDATATKAIIEAGTTGDRYLIAGNPFTGSQIRRDVSRSASDPAVSVSKNWVHVSWIDEDSDAPGSLLYWRFH